MEAGKKRAGEQAEYLVIQAARFGDLVQTKRLLSSLAASAPVRLAVDKSLLDMASLLYPHIALAGIDFHRATDVNTLRELEKQLAELGKGSYYKIFNCNFSALSAAICRMFPDKTVTGYRSARNSLGSIRRSEWLRLVWSFVKRRAITSLNLVDSWAWLSRMPLSGTDINPPAHKGGKGLGIVVSGRESRRSLPVSVLAPIAATCFRVLGQCDVILLGTEADQRSARRLLRLLPAAMQAKTRDLTGKTSYGDLMAELTDLDLLLSPDTGSMHLAAHLGVPVMAFFLSSAWCHETGPYGSGHLVWQTALPCSPCLESAPCPHKHACLAPYGDENFPRLIAQALQGKTMSLPDGLQLWKTHFDSLGQFLELLAGKDQYALPRQAGRHIAEKFLGLAKAVEDESFPMDLLEQISTELFPSSEWMLPPWRYC